MKKELGEPKESPEANIYLDLQRATFKKIPNWKFWFLKNSHSLMTDW